MALKITCPYCDTRIDLAINHSKQDSGIAQVRAQWPDGTTSYHTWTECISLVRNLGGHIVRPLVLTCDIDFERITHEPTRRRIQEQFRKAKIYIPA